jgi:hypothetical protein
MIDPRRLAAVDLAFLGPIVILSEFALGVVGPIALGAFTWHKSQSLGWTLFGVYLMTLGINYLPMLLHAIDLVRKGSAQLEIADEAGDRQRLFRKYRAQSHWLLVPLVAPLAALSPSA